MKNNYYEKFINFFKEHNLYDKIMFDYIENNCVRFDYRDTGCQDYMGCYYSFSKDRKLENIRLIVPYIIDEKTLLVNIHKYMYAIMHFPRLNKTCEFGICEEVIPMLFEKIYVLENPNKELEDYLDNIDTCIQNSTNKEDEKYKIALNLREELISEYQKENNNIKSLNKKAKTLAKKHKNS